MEAAADRVERSARPRRGRLHRRARRPAGGLRRRRHHARHGRVGAALARVREAAHRAGRAGLLPHADRGHRRRVPLAGLVRRRARRRRSASRDCRTSSSSLLADARRRADLGAFGRRLVEEFSLEGAAQRQLAIYRDAFAARAQQQRPWRDAVRSLSAASPATTAASSCAGRAAGGGRTTSTPRRSRRPTALRDANAPAPLEGPILWFPGVGWDTLAGTDRHLAMERRRAAPDRMGRHAALGAPRARPRRCRR